MEVTAGKSRYAMAQLRPCVALLALACAGGARAAGTDADSRIDNAAQVICRVAGVDQPTVANNTVSLVVDELLDVVVTSSDAAAVAVTRPRAVRC